MGWLYLAAMDMPKNGTRWRVEERGLANLRTTADALLTLKEEYIEDLFEKTGVLTPVELESRFEVYAEQYILFNRS